MFQAGELEVVDEGEVDEGQSGENADDSPVDAKPSNVASALHDAAGECCAPVFTWPHSLSHFFNVRAIPACLDR